MNNFLQATPFFRLLLPWIAGYLISRYLAVEGVLMWILASVIVLLAVLYPAGRKWFDTHNNRWVFGLFLFSGIFIVSVLRSAAVSQPDFIPPENDTTATYLVQVEGLPAAGENVIVMDASLLGILSAQKTFNDLSGKIRVSLRVDSTTKSKCLLHHGDYLLLSTRMKPPRPASNPGGFDAGKYLRNQGIGAQAFVDAGKWKVTGYTSSVRRAAGFAAEKVIAVFENAGMHGNELAVMSALILGIKDDLNDELKLDYSRSGAMHILAVSGMHVAVIYMVLNLLLSQLFRSQKFRIPKNLIIILFLWFYAFITGMSASVLRATVMFTFVATGFALDRKSIMYNTISLSALVILMFYPNHILDPGLQLSYAAVIGIVYFQPGILKWFSPRNKILRMAWEMTAVTLSAQIATLPVTLFYFNQFPNYFLLSNFLAVPLSTGIIYLAIVLLVISPFTWLAGVLGWISQLAVHLLNGLMGWVHHLPGSVSLVYVSLPEMVLMYVALIFLMFYLVRKRYISLLMSLLAVFVISLSGLFRIYSNIQEAQLVLFSDNKNTHLLLREGQLAKIWTTDRIKCEKIIRPYLVYHQVDRPEFTKLTVEESIFFEFHHKKYGLVTGDSWKNRQSDRQLQLDVLLLGQGVKKSAGNLLKLFHPELCVIGKGHSAWYTESIANLCSGLSVDTWLVGSQGAYIQNFFSNFADI